MNRRRAPQRGGTCCCQLQVGAGLAGLRTGARAGTRLLVSATNHTHQLFSALHPEQPPAAVFEGHIAGSFYVRACFSGDGRHILSGSSDSRGYIWEARPRPPRPRWLAAVRRAAGGVLWLSCASRGARGTALQRVLEADPSSPARALEDLLAACRARGYPGAHMDRQW